MTDFRLSTKFMACFGAILLLVIGSGALSMIQLGRMQHASSELAENWLASTRLAIQLQAATDARRIAEGIHITSKRNDITQIQEQAIRKADADFARAATAFSALLDSPQDRAHWQALTDARTAYLAVSAQVLALSRANQDQQALALYTYSERERFDAQTAAMDAINSYNGAGGLAEARNATAVNLAGRDAALGSMGVGLLLVLGLLYLLRRQVSVPIGKLNQTMQTLAAGNTAIDVPGTERRDEIGDMAKTVLVFRDAAIAKADADTAKADADAIQQMVVDTVGNNLVSLARGDLSVVITSEFPGVYAALKTNFNAATASLRDLIGSVTETAGSVLTGSNEIAQASEDLARRTEGNAASLEQTSAAIQQIDVRLKATAVAAERSVAGSEQTMAAVGEGRTRTDQAVQAMGRVSDSAKGIDSVIEGLDKIAFQTRVLAMNAAVEAGRAGDAGRGFAVVADLVSALAMRAEEEAKRARDQLTVTQSEIVSAVDAVEKVEAALSDIFAAGREATTLAHQIATDNLAQASAISQVSIAIGAMDQSTQQNAAMVEQTSAAARNLTAEVAALTAQARQFEIGEARPVATRAQGKTPAAAGRKPATAAVAPVKPLAMAGGDDADWNSF